MAVVTCASCYRVDCFRFDPHSAIPSLKSAVREVCETRRPLIVTVDGKPGAVLQDYETWRRTQETIAMLNLLAMGKKEIEEGRGIPAREAFRKIREKYGFL